MATVCVTVPDDQAARIAAAVCGRDRYVPTSAQDGIEYVQAQVFVWLRGITLEYEAQRAQQAVLTNPDDPLVGAVITQGEGETGQ